MCVNQKIIEVNKSIDNKTIWKTPDYITKQWDKNLSAEIIVKCGQCIECKLERGRNWTYKIFLESLSYKEKCFITLTHKEDEKGKELNKKLLQDFIKRLRKQTKKEIKYFAAGEYGERKGRAHYHIIILGYAPNDLVYGGKTKRGNDFYFSKEVKRLWQNQGRITVQKFSYEEINYLTLYLNTNRKIKNINDNVNKKWHHIKNNIRVKHGLSKISYYDNDNKKKSIVYTPIKRIKDMTAEERSKYNKDYQKARKNFKLNLQPEFNLFSKNMGFNNWIEKKYYKYKLIIENHEFETPKEYLRKVIENPDQYNEEIYQYSVYEILSRKDFAQTQYNILTNYSKSDNIKISNFKSQMRGAEKIKIDKHFTKRKLNIKIESDF